MPYIIEKNGFYFTGQWAKETPISDGNGLRYKVEWGPFWTKDRSKAKVYRSFSIAEGDAIGANGTRYTNYMDTIKDIPETHMNYEKHLRSLRRKIFDYPEEKQAKADRIMLKLIKKVKENEPPRYIAPDSFDRIYGGWLG